MHKKFSSRTLYLEMNQGLSKNEKGSNARVFRLMAALAAVRMSRRKHKTFWDATFSVESTIDDIEQKIVDVLNEFGDMSYCLY